MHLELRCISIHLIAIDTMGQHYLCNTRQLVYVLCHKFMILIVYSAILSFGFSMLPINRLIFASNVKNKGSYFDQLNT